MTTVTAATYELDFSSVAIPFTVTDMLGTAVNFIAMYGEWILLVLAVIFAPVLYDLAMKLVAEKKAKMGKK